MELTHYERFAGWYFGNFRPIARKLIAENPKYKQDPMRLSLDVINKPGVFASSDPNAPIRYNAYVIEGMYAVIKNKDCMFDFGTLTSDKAYTEYLEKTYSVIGAGLGKNFEATLLLEQHINYHVLTYEAAGKKTYTVSPGLAIQLANTKLKDVLTDDLRLPFPAIYVIVPKEAGLKVWNHTTQWHEVVGIYIIEEANLNSADPALPATRGWRILIVGQELSTDIPGDDALVYGRIPLAENVLIDGVAFDTSKEYATFTQHSHGHVEGIQESWLNVFNWILNLTLYITHVERGKSIVANPEVGKLQEKLGKAPKGSNKRQKILDEMKTTPEYRRINLGQSIVVDRAREGAEGTSKGAGRSLLVQVPVAGHWRRVPHGPKRSERRWQWIQPYVKNPGGIPTNKPHIVK